MNNNVDEVKESEVKIFCSYLILISAVLYVIFFYKERAEAIDNIYDTDYAKQYPDRFTLLKLMAILLFVGQGVLLYYSYKDLQRDIESYNRTGHPIDIEASYNYFYFKLFTVVGIAIFLYTVFFIDIDDEAIT